MAEEGSDRSKVRDLPLGRQIITGPSTVALRRLRDTESFNGVVSFANFAVRGTRWCCCSIGQRRNLPGASGTTAKCVGRTQDSESEGALVDTGRAEAPGAGLVTRCPVRRDFMAPHSGLGITGCPGLMTLHFG